MKSGLLLGALGVLFLLGGCVAVPYEPYGYSPVHGSVVIQGGGGHDHHHDRRRHRNWR
jgi:hypothetical protein